MLFMVCSLSMTLRAVPTMQDFVRVTRALGLCVPLAATSAELYLSEIVKEVIHAFRMSIAAHIKTTDPYKFPMILGYEHLVVAMRAHTPTILAYPYATRYKSSRVMYIGPWVLDNRGGGDCLPYALLHSLYAMRGRQAFQNQEPLQDQGLSTSLRNSNEHIMGNMVQLRRYCKLFFQDFDARIGAETVPFFTKIKQEDGTEVIKEHARPELVRDFLYRSSEMLGDNEDVNFGPEALERREFVAKKELAIISTAGSRDYPGPAMMYAFMHKLQEPRALAVYTWNTSTNKLQRSGEATCIVRDGAYMVPTAEDAMLAPRILHPFTRNTPLKSLGLKVERNVATWTEPARPHQNHFSIKRSGPHYTALFSALGYFELSHLMDVADLKPVFNS
jgi:hypothetical protein